MSAPTLVQCGHRTRLHRRLDARIDPMIPAVEESNVMNGYEILTAPHVTGVLLILATIFAPGVSTLYAREG